MKYALVDDELFFHDIFKEVLVKYNCLAELDCFSDGNLFIQALSNSHFDVVFLDIEMPSFNGFQVAEFMHLKGYETLVVYITNRSDAVFDAYGLNVIGFIEKKNIDKRFPTILKKIENEFSQSEYILIKESASEMVKIPKSAVALIERKSRKIYLYTISGETYIVKDQTLKELKQQLGPKLFVSPDRSVIVNLRAVLKVTKTKAYIKNHSEPVYISKYKSKEFFDSVIEDMKL